MLCEAQKALRVGWVLKGWSSIWLMAGRSRGEEERSSVICFFGMVSLGRWWLMEKRLRLL